MSIVACGKTYWTTDHEVVESGFIGPEDLHVTGDLRRDSLF